MRGEGGRVWQRGMCIVVGVWQGGVHGKGVCRVVGGCMAGGMCGKEHAWQGGTCGRGCLWPPQWTVCILLECIPVLCMHAGAPRDNMNMFIL